jgi:hypothetical protein
LEIDQNKELGKGSGQKRIMEKYQSKNRCKGSWKKITTKNKGQVSGQRVLAKGFNKNLSKRSI